MHGERVRRGVRQCRPSFDCPGAASASTVAAVVLFDPQRAKGYDTSDFVSALRAMNVRPHLAQKRWSAIDARITRHPGYLVSQKKRPLIESTFVWMKAVAGIRKLKLRGLRNVRLALCYDAAAFTFGVFRTEEGPSIVKPLKSAFAAPRQLQTFPRLPFQATFMPCLCQLTTATRFPTSS